MTAPLQDVEPFVHGQTFEEMTVGSSFRTGWRTITEADMVMFRQLVGITEPLFMDNRHAAESGLHRHAGARHDDVSPTQKGSFYRRMCCTAPGSPSCTATLTSRRPCTSATRSR